MQRRPVSPFSLSFLDIMFCGFGAVVLLVLVLNTDTVRTREQAFKDLRGEALALQTQVLDDEAQLSGAREALASARRQLRDTLAASEDLRDRQAALTGDLTRLQADTRASRADIETLEPALRSLEERQRRLEAQAEAGRQVRSRIGEGERQYLTGLKVGGSRILILLDGSASMLDETLVNVVRRRNMSQDNKRMAPKWRRAVAAANWMLAQLPPDARFQLYVFNTRARAALPASEGRWLSASDAGDLDAVSRALEAFVPGDGTRLYSAFEVANALSPKPDNLLLITDGLPTQGRKAPAADTVSGDARLGFFDQAVARLPGSLPVNTLLLPMEGDAWAAAAYWRLALETRGAFLTPARDWP